MIRHGRIALLFLIGLMGANTLFAQDVPVEAIPDDVSVVIKLKQPEKTIEHVVALVKKVQPNFAPLLQMQSNMIGLGISNPGLTGVDKADDWWLALFMKKAGEPDVVFIIPTTNLDAAQKAIPAGHKSFGYKKWLIYSDNEAALNRLKDRAEKAKGSPVSDRVDAETKNLLMDSTVSAYFNLAVIKALFQNEIDQAPQKVQEEIDQFAEMTPEIPGLKMEGLAKVYLEFAKKFLQGVKDSNSYTVGVTVDEQGLTIDKLFKVVPRSETAGLLAGVVPVAMTRLDTLPQDQLGYFGLHCDLNKITAWASTYLSELFDLDSEQAEKINAVLNAYSKQKWGGVYSSFTLGEIDDGVLRSASLMEVELNDETKQTIRKASQIGNDLNVGGLKQSVELKVDAETIDNHKVDVVKMKQEIDPAQDPLGMQKKLMDILYGSDGLTTRTVYLKDMIVQTIGGKAYTQKILKAVTQPAATADAHTQTTARKALGEKANLIGLIDLPRLVLTIAKTAINSGQLPAIPVDTKALTDIELKPSYIGFAVRSETNGLRIRTQIPVEQMISISTLVERVMKIYQDMQAPEQQF